MSHRRTPEPGEEGQAATPDPKNKDSAEAIRDFPTFGKFDSRLAGYVDYLLAESLRLRGGFIALNLWQQAFVHCVMGRRFAAWQAIHGGLGWLAQLEGVHP
jgi:hypothetical protein